MKTVSIDGSQLQSIELIRIGLSEETNELRLRAIENVMQGAMSDQFDMLADRGGPKWLYTPENVDFIHLMAKTDKSRRNAQSEFAQTIQRYEGENGLGNERKLNIAEQIGKLVWASIRDGRFKGLHTKNGILERVQHMARKDGVRGGRDPGTLNKIWTTYRGIVHGAIAMDHYENEFIVGLNVLRRAETVRRALSESCPRGTSKPYVDPAQQISFRFISMS